MAVGQFSNLSGILNETDAEQSASNKYRSYIEAARGLFVYNLEARILDGLETFVYRRTQNETQQNGEARLKTISNFSNIKKWVNLILSLGEPLNAICDGEGHQDVGILEKVLGLTMKYFIKEGLIACFLNSVVLNNRLNRICRELDSLGVRANILVPWKLNHSVDDDNNGNFEETLSHQNIYSGVNSRMLKSEENLCGITSQFESHDPHLPAELSKETHDYETINLNHTSSEKNFELAESLIENRTSCESSMTFVKSISGASRKSSRSFKRSISQADWTIENLGIQINQLGINSGGIVSLPCESESIIHQLVDSQCVSSIECLKSLRKNTKTGLANISSSMNDILMKFDKKNIRRCCLCCKIRGNHLKIKLKKRDPDGCMIDLLSDLIIIHKKRKSKDMKLMRSRKATISQSNLNCSCSPVEDNCSTRNSIEDNNRNEYTNLEETIASIDELDYAAKVPIFSSSFANDDGGKEIDTIDNDFDGDCSCTRNSQYNESFLTARSESGSLKIDSLSTDLTKTENKNEFGTFLSCKGHSGNVADDPFKEKIIQVLTSIEKNILCSGKKCNDFAHCRDTQKSEYSQTSGGLEFSIISSESANENCNDVQQSRIIEILKSIFKFDDRDRLKLLKILEKTNRSEKDDELIVIKSSNTSTRIESKALDPKTDVNLPNTVPRVHEHRESNDIQESHSLQGHDLPLSQVRSKIHTSLELLNEAASSLICILEANSKKLEKSSTNVSMMNRHRVRPPNQFSQVDTSLLTTSFDSLPDGSPTKWMDKRTKIRCIESEINSSKIQASNLSINEEKFVHFLPDIQGIKSVITAVLRSIKKTLSQPKFENFRYKVKNKIFRHILSGVRANDISEGRFDERRKCKHYFISDSSRSTTRQIPTGHDVNAKICLRVRRKHHNEFKLYSDSIRPKKKCTRGKKLCTCCNRRFNMSAIYLHQPDCICGSHRSGQVNRSKNMTSNLNSLIHPRCSTKLSSKNRGKSSSKSKNIPTPSRIDQTDCEYRFLCPEENEECPGIDKHFQSMLKQYVYLCKNIKYSLLKRRPDDIYRASTTSIRCHQTKSQVKSRQQQQH